MRFELMLSMVFTSVMVCGCASLVSDSACGGGRRGHFILVSSTGTVKEGAVSHPYIVPFSTSRMVVTYFPANALEGHTGLMAADWPIYSDDSGETWRSGDPFIWRDGQPPVVTSVTAGQYVAKGGHYGYFFGFIVCSNGSRFATQFDVQPDPSRRYRAKGVWSEGGNEWNGPGEIEFVYPTDLGGGVLTMPARGLELLDGRLALTVYGKFGKTYETHFFTSLDRGRTFTYESTVATRAESPWGPLGPCEPGIVQFPDGELLCLMRTGSTGYGIAGEQMVQSRSHDGGKTWQHEKSFLSGVMPRLVLTDSGRLYCIYGRPGNEVSVSHNRGKSWRSHLSLTPADRFTSGYCDMLALPGGCGFFVFDRWMRSPEQFWLWEPPAPRNCIYGRFHELP